MIQDDLKKNNIQAASKFRLYMVLRHMNFCLVIYICSKNPVCGSVATSFSCYVSVEYVMLCSGKRFLEDTRLIFSIPLIFVEQEHFVY